MSHTKLLTCLISATTLLLAAPIGCGGDDEEGGSAGKEAAAPLTPAERMCSSVSDAINSCGSATLCDQALVADCADVVGLLSDSYLESAATCIEGGGVPQSCMVDALGALQPTAAHGAFGASFCETCAFGLPGCEETLFSGEGEFAVVGKLLLPFSDSLVEELAATCTASALDCPNIPQCFQGVIAQHALPENTIACVVDNFTGAAPPEEASTCAAPVDGTSTDGATSTGTGSGTSTGDGTGNGTGNDTGTGTGGVCNDLDMEPNDYEGDTSLGTIDDHDSSGGEIVGTLNGNDTDWYVYDGVDVPGAFVDPAVSFSSDDDLMVVCQFLECDGAEVTCPTGTSDANSPMGLPGCCSYHSFELPHDCAGIIDGSARIHIQVSQQGAVDQCVDYSVWYHF